MKYLLLLIPLKDQNKKGMKKATIPRPLKLVQISFWQRKVINIPNGDAISLTLFLVINFNIFLMHYLISRIYVSSI